MLKKNIIKVEVEEKKVKNEICEASFQYQLTSKFVYCRDFGGR